MDSDRQMSTDTDTSITCSNCLRFVNLFERYFLDETLQQHDIPFSDMYTKYSDEIVQKSLLEIINFISLQEISLEQLSAGPKYYFLVLLRTLKDHEEFFNAPLAIAEISSSTGSDGSESKEKDENHLFFKTMHFANIGEYNILTSTSPCNCPCCRTQREFYTNKEKGDRLLVHFSQTECEYFKQKPNYKQCTKACELSLIALGSYHFIKWQLIEHPKGKSYSQLNDK